MGGTLTAYSEDAPIVLPGAKNSNSVDDFHVKTSHFIRVLSEYHNIAYINCNNICYLITSTVVILLLLWDD